MKPVGTAIWTFSDGTTRVTDAYTQFNVLAHAEIYEIAIPQACGGQAECGTCRVHVLSGEVSPMLPDEAELRAQHPRSFAADERLACRARPLGDVSVRLRGRPPVDLRDHEG